MKILKIVLILVVGITITSCSVSRPLLLTDNSNEKTGEASYNVILGVFRPMNADVSIRKAAENGGITKVSSVDVVVESKLFKRTYKTVVTGN